MLEFPSYLSSLTFKYSLRARPVTLHPHLHLHFYIRDVDADAGKCPTQPGKIEIWMKKFGGGAEFPAFLRFMQGANYQLKTNKFFDVFEIIGAAFTGELHLQVSPESFTGSGEFH
jgi:hypothetical protein